MYSVYAALRSSGYSSVAINAEDTDMFIQDAAHDILGILTQFLFLHWQVH